MGERDYCQRASHKVSYYLRGKRFVLRSSNHAMTIASSLRESTCDSMKALFGSCIGIKR